MPVSTSLKTEKRNEKTASIQRQGTLDPSLREEEEVFAWDVLLKRVAASIVSKIPGISVAMGWSEVAWVGPPWQLVPLLPGIGIAGWTFRSPQRRRCHRRVHPNTGTIRWSGAWHLPPPKDV